MYSSFFFHQVLVNQQEEETGSDDLTNQPDDEENHEYTRVTTFDDDVTDFNLPAENDVTAVGSKKVDHSTSKIVKTTPKQPEIVISSAPASGRRPSMTRDQMRKNVINEIINSERVFMRHLKDVIEVSYYVLKFPIP